MTPEAEPVGAFVDYQASNMPRTEVISGKRKMSDNMGQTLYDDKGINKLTSVPDYSSHHEERVCSVIDEDNSIGYKYNASNHELGSSEGERRSSLDNLELNVNIRGNSNSLDRQQPNQVFPKQEPKVY